MLFSTNGMIESDRFREFGRSLPVTVIETPVAPIHSYLLRGPQAPPTDSMAGSHGGVILRPVHRLARHADPDLLELRSLRGCSQSSEGTVSLPKDSIVGEILRCTSENLGSLLPLSFMGRLCQQGQASYLEVQCLHAMRIWIFVASLVPLLNHSSDKVILTPGPTNLLTHHTAKTQTVKPNPKAPKRNSCPAPFE